MATCFAPVSVSGGSHLKARELWLTKRDSLIAPKLTVQRKSNLVSRKCSSSICADYRDGGQGRGGDFVAGFPLGGVVFGTLTYIFAPQTFENFEFSNSSCVANHLARENQGKTRKKYLKLSSNLSRLSLLDSSPKGIRVSRRVETVNSDGDDWKKKQETFTDTDSDEEKDIPPPLVDNDPYLTSLEERLEWRRKIREVMDMNPDVQEEVDPVEKKKKMQKLLTDYPLIVEEDDPDWPEDADGWGFNLGQFFDKITIKNTKKVDEDNYDSDNEVVWQDDNYIRPIKDIKTAEWEETVFKDISPLVILVHNRYKRPKENERIRDELERAVHIIWNCRLPSPRCVAIDAVVETELVAALQVSVFPELIFTKAGKILFREKAIRGADELSKIMAFFYYGAAKPPCLSSITITNVQEDIPTVLSPEV